MTNSVKPVEHLEALLDGLEHLILKAETPEAMSATEAAELSQSMRLILASSAARANVEADPRSDSRRRATQNSPAVRLSELRALLTPPQIGRTQMSATFNVDDPLDGELDVLIGDIERIMSGRQKN